MNWAYFFPLILLVTQASHAQTNGGLPFGNFMPTNIEVVSHYPDSAFVSRRLLPFQLRGVEGIRLQSVRITRGDSCVGILDPFYPDTGHIRCQNPEIVVAEVVFHAGSDENRIVILGPFQILAESSPPEMASPPGGAP